jgi:ubiquinone/menaquinone biosynthesis C-methylase UbiE
MQPQFGIDHQNTIRNILIGGSTFLATTALLHFKPVAVEDLLKTDDAVHALKIFTGTFGVFLTVEGTLMYVSSKYWKIKQASKLVNSLKLKGDEKVLDVGCGSGLFVTEFAKQVPNGAVYGIDRWNYRVHEGIALENCKVTGVDNRTHIKTGDVTESLPFGDNFFDYVFANSTMHNLSRKSRSTTFLEMLRVLKPGGTMIIQDVKYGEEYENELKKNEQLEVYLTPFEFSLFPPVQIVTVKKKSF